MRRLHLALAVLFLAMGPLEKNQDDVADGMRAYDDGNYEQAVQAFERAEKARPGDARVHYDKGLALHKLGRTDDAKQALTRALELDRSGELTSKIHYNLGTIAAAAGQKEEAVRELRRALKKDPKDELARHNLEVLLRDLPPKQQGQDGGAPDGGKSDGGRPDAGVDGGRPDGGADAGSPDGGPKDGGEADGGNQADGGADAGPPGKDGGQGDGGAGDGGEGEKPKPGDGGVDGGAGDGGDEGNKPERADGGADGGRQDVGDGGAPQPVSLVDGGMTPQEAEKLLEPLKRNEKNLQLWRFRQKTQKNDPNGKDW